MQHSFLLKELVRRDLQSRYRGSLFGFLWAFVHPLWQLVLLWVVFSVILKVPLTGERTASFPVFLFSGLVPWLGFAEGIQRAATAVVEHSGLVRKLRFPSELLVVSSSASALIHQFVAAAIGLGWAASALQVFFRDVAQGLGIALQAWFYLTPIVYPLSLIPEGLRPWMALNPMATAVQAFRTVLLGGPPPTAGAALALAAIALATMGLGWALFRRLRSAFADEL